MTGKLKENEANPRLVDGRRKFNWEFVTPVYTKFKSLTINKEEGWARKLLDMKLNSKIKEEQVDGRTTSEE